MAQKKTAKIFIIFFIVICAVLGYASYRGWISGVGDYGHTERDMINEQN